MTFSITREGPWNIQKPKSTANIAKRIITKKTTLCSPKPFIWISFKNLPNNRGCVNKIIFATADMVKNTTTHRLWPSANRHIFFDKKTIGSCDIFLDNALIFFSVYQKFGLVNACQFLNFLAL